MLFKQNLLMPKTLILFLLFCSLSLPISAQQIISNKKLIGKTSFYHLIWHVYDISLHNSSGNFSFKKPFTLMLHYKRDVTGKKIADVSADYMKKIGFQNDKKLALWHKKMQEIFPDVENGTILTGVYYPNNKTVFYRNDDEIGTITDTEFGKWFFNIWLSEKTAFPKMRAGLLGISHE